MNLDWYSVQKTVNDLCARSDMKLVFEEGVDQPRTDYKQSSSRNLTPIGITISLLTGLAASTMRWDTTTGIC